MAIRKKFSSVEELDNLFKVINKNKEASTPSEILVFYKELESLINEIYEKGYDHGYGVGAEIKRQINENLN